LERDLHANVKERVGMSMMHEAIDGRLAAAVEAGDILGGVMG
jgi:hypothetical protein